MTNVTSLAHRHPERRFVHGGGDVAVGTALLYGALAALYVLFRVGSFSNIPVRLTDTRGYENVARLSVADPDFYTGERGFTIPLFWKVFGGAEPRIVAQLAFSIVAWLVLAAMAARCIRAPKLRPLAFALVLGFSLTTEVVLWDTLLLSESVTFALTALLFAAWLAFARSPRRLSAVAVLVLSLLWAFARDTNAYVVLVAGALVTLTLVRPGQRRLKLVLAAGCCAIFLLDYGSADAGKRWLQPVRDVVAHRVLPSAELRPYFIAHGLDLSTNWPDSDWIAHRARRVYARFLLSHPGYTLAAPFHGHQQALYSTAGNAASLIDPALAGYDDNAGHRFLPLPRGVERVLFPRGIPVVLGLLAVAFAATAAAALRFGFDPTWLVPLALLVTTYPHFLVVWHQSGVEVDRHALEAALLLRLALLLQLLFVMAALAARRRSAATRVAPRPFA